MKENCQFIKFDILVKELVNMKRVNQLNALLVKLTNCWKANTDKTGDLDHSKKTNMTNLTLVMKLSKADVCFKNVEEDFELMVLLNHNNTEGVKM